VIPWDMLVDLVLEHPLIPQKSVPVVVYNEINGTYGTGINAVAPGHDLEALRIALVSILHDDIHSSAIQLA
jgi:valyl-tRNA synthetase